MATMRIKPARKGLRVVFPGTRRVLAAEGEEVQLNTHWYRRLRSGDVVEVQPKRTREPGAREEPKG